jgi:hypothetical protein
MQVHAAMLMAGGKERHWIGGGWIDTESSQVVVDYGEALACPRQRREERTSMSGSSGNWKAEISPVDDPLAAYRKQPVISGAGSNATYVGRVVIELWSDGGVSDDAKMIAITADAVDGKHANLLERVALALTRRMQQGNPLA